MKHWKQAVAIGLVGVTIGVFLYTWHAHPELLRQLKNIQSGYVVMVVFLYGLMIALLVGIYDTTLRLCGSRLGLREQTLLTMYSSIVNFFGPLQSGPGVRTVYLKKRHGVSIKKYAAATVLYYLLFAGISGLFLLSGIRPLWHAVAFGVGALFLGAAALWFGRVRLWRYAFVKNFSPALVARLAVLTAAQVVLVSCIYFTELHAVHASASYAQTAVYAGAANFSLFVSLTPGALGIREAFLLFSRRLHHIPSGTILSANLIDRSVYIVFLGVLFLLVLGLHAQDRFKLRANSAD
jgi:uncharacterized membrane protein YbhN (UPF0104 family)